MVTNIVMRGGKRPWGRPVQTTYRLAGHNKLTAVATYHGEMVLSGGNNHLMPLVWRPGKNAEPIRTLKEYLALCVWQQTLIDARASHWANVAVSALVPSDFLAEIGDVECDWPPALEYRWRGVWLKCIVNTGKSSFNLDQPSCVVDNCSLGHSKIAVDNLVTYTIKIASSNQQRSYCQI